MPRKFMDDLRSGQVWKFRVPRGKCRYGPREQSVRDVGGQWWGESGHSFECDYAPPDVHLRCGGTGRIDMTDEEAALEGWEGAGPRPQKMCQRCGGTGYVPGPHWPYRWPKPPPLRQEDAT